jgi:hypothetical protein
MPYLIALGLGYLAFGLFFNKIETKKFQLNLLLSILCLIWVVSYAISCIKYMEVFFNEVPIDVKAFKFIGYVFAGFGFVAVFALLTVPQYIIGKRIKMEKNNYE